MANFDSNRFASTKQEWTTPQDLFDVLDAEFHFTCDLAADAENTKCENFFDEHTDALTQTWWGTCWLNPPYGSKSYKLQDWVKKAGYESLKPECCVVMLIPARTNTRWWHTYCMTAKEIRFICGRPKFGGSMHGLPQPLALVVFDGLPAVAVCSSFRYDAK